MDEAALCRYALPMTSGVKDSVPVPIANVADDLTEEMVAWTPHGPVIRPPASEIIGLVSPWRGRARSVLLALLQGATRGGAATVAGVPLRAVEKWCRDQADFRRAVEIAQGWGFAATYERELHERAMDRKDRGSARLLEMVVKSRDAAYRDKSTLQLEVVQRAQEAVQELSAGWASVDEQEGNPS